GIALGLLFVPLTTATMGDLPREEIGNASTLFNLVRNVGSSIGIASVSTMLTRARHVHVATLSTHITAYDSSVRIAFDQLRQMFQLHPSGSPPEASALAVLNAMAQRQAALLSFIDMFRLLGVIFLVMIPLVFVMRKPHQGPSPVVVS